MIGHFKQPPARRGRRLGALALIALALGGCARYHDLTAFQLEPHPLSNGKTYHVAPPDVLQISSSVVNEVNGLAVVISPDGTIMMPLLGTVHVAGRSTDEIAELLRQKAERFYSSADITVNVQSFRSKHVYVFGEVRYAGRFPYSGANTVLELLAAAQPTRAADPNRIQVLRPTGDGQEASRMTINLAQWVEEGVTDRNALLEDGDIIYVPPNGFAQVGYAVQNLLRPVSPAAATVQGVANVDSSSQSLSSQQ